VALLPAGTIGLWLLFRRGRRREFAPFIAALAIVLALGIALGGGRTSLQPLEKASTRVAGSSVWAPLDRHDVTEQEGRGVRPQIARQDASNAVSRLASIAVLVAAGLLAVAWSGETSPAIVAGVGVLAYTLLGAYVLPWYAAAALFAF